MYRGDNLNLNSKITEIDELYQIGLTQNNKAKKSLEKI